MAEIDSAPSLNVASRDKKLVSVRQILTRVDLDKKSTVLRQKIASVRQPLGYGCYDNLVCGSK